LAVVSAVVGSAFPEQVLLLLWVILSPVAWIAGALGTRAWRVSVACVPVLSIVDSTRLGLWARYRVSILRALSTTKAIHDSDELLNVPTAAQEHLRIDSVLQLLGTSSSRSSLPGSSEGAELSRAIRESAEAALRWGAARFPKNVKLHLQTAAFFKSTGGNRYLELSALNSAKQLSNSLDVNFGVYQRNRELRDTGGASAGKASVGIKVQSSSVDRLLVDQHSSAASKHDLRSRETLVRVWEALQSTSPDMHQLANLGRRLKLSAESADSHYRSLLKLQRQSIQLLRQYGDFLGAVLGRIQKADELLAKADRLQESALARANQKVQGFQLLQACQRGSAVLEVTSAFTLSGDLNNLGEITHASSRAAHLLLKAPSTLVGTSGFDIFPAPINRCIERLVLDHIRQKQGRVLSHARFAFVQDSMRQLKTVQFTCEESPPEENELTIHFCLTVNEVKVDVDFFLCTLLDDKLSLQAASPASTRMLGDDNPHRLDERSLLQQCETEIRHLLEQESSFEHTYDQLSGLEISGGKTFDIESSYDEHPGRTRIRMHLLRFDPSITGGNTKFLVRWHELDSNDRPLKRAESRFHIQSPQAPALNRANSLALGRLGPLQTNSRQPTQMTQQTFTFQSAGSSWALDSAAAPVTDADLDELADVRVVSVGASLAGTVSHNASFRISPGDDSSIRKSATAVSVREQRKFAGTLRRELSTVTESQRELLSTTQGSVASYANYKMDMKGPGVGTLQEVDSVDGRLDFLPPVVELDSKNSAPVSIAPGASPTAPARHRPAFTQSSLDGSEAPGSVGSGASSGSQTHAARQALSKYLLDDHELDSSLRKLRKGLRLAFVFAVCLGLVAILGTDTVFSQARRYLIGMVNAGRALRMMQGASVSAAQLGLAYAGVATGIEASIRSSLLSETTALRSAWREVVADAESFDSPEVRQALGGLRSLVSMQHPDSPDPSIVTLNAAMGRTISNFDLLSTSDAGSDFLASSAPYFSVTVNVPGPLVDSVNQTLSLRATQMSDYMGLVEANVFLALMVGASLIGTTLACFLWATMDAVDSQRRGPGELLVTLSMPAVKLLLSFQKSSLKRFKAVYEEDQETGMSDSDASEEDGGEGANSETSSVGSSKAHDLENRLMHRHGSSISVNSSGQQKVGSMLRDKGNFKITNLLLFMAQSFLLALWLGAFSAGMYASHSDISQDMAKLYSSQQLLSQMLRVAQTATVAVAADRSLLPSTAVELQSAIVLSAQRLGAVLQGKKNDEIAGGEVRSLSTDSEAFSLLTRDACEVISSLNTPPANCSEFGGGVMSLGVQILLQRYMQHARLYLSTLDSLQPASYSVKNALSVLVAQNATARAETLGLGPLVTAEILNSSIAYGSIKAGLTVILSIEDPYLRASMATLEILLLRQTDVHLKEAWDLFLVINTVYICLSTLLYAAFHAKRLSMIQATLNGARTLLLAVPTEYLLRNRRFSKEYKSFVAKVIASKGT